MTHCRQKGNVMPKDHFGNTIQITPADSGWQAVYAGKDEGYVTIPLACWALVHCGEYEGTATTGMIAYPRCRELVYAADEPHFLGYTSPGDTSDWNARAQSYRTSRMCDGGKKR